MVHQNYQKFIVLTSNMIYIVALGVGFKCPSKVHLNTQCPSQILGPSYGPDLMAKLPLHFAKKFSPTPFMLIEIDHKVTLYLLIRFDKVLKKSHCFYSTFHRIGPCLWKKHKRNMARPGFEPVGHKELLLNDHKHYYGLCLIPKP